MSNEQVLILGGGLMGLAIAHQLARRGRCVTVLSRRRNEGCWPPMLKDCVANCCNLAS